MTEFEVGELLTVSDELRVFPHQMQTKTLWLLEGEPFVIVSKRITKARGSTTRCDRNLWYVMLTARLGIVESGEAVISGFHAHVTRTR